MKFPNPKEIHAYQNEDGSYKLIVKNPVYKRFGLPNGKFMGYANTTIVNCKISMKVIAASGEVTIGGEYGEESTDTER
ncbi:MAG: hypothetical protein IKV00_07470 [Clostridia bacterium]|nr:hypothetical protein [Clostridia bacterium]